MTIQNSLGIVALAALLCACTEKPQTVSTRKADVEPWQGPPDAFMAQGWKVGDKDSWEKQIRQRAQSQNEYSRAPAQP
jgi:hypothetical protein